MPSLKAMAREAQTKPQSAATKQPTSRKRTLFKSAERVEESNSGSETESESGSDLEEVTAVKIAPVRKLNAQKLNSVTAESEVQGMEDEENDEQSHYHAVTSSRSKDASGENSRQSSGTSSLESEDESGSGSGSSGDGGSDESSVEGKESDSELEQASQHTKFRLPAKHNSSHVEEKSQAVPNEEREIPKYNPPDGFTLDPGSKPGKPKVIDVFGGPNLAGKQLWYITAPMSVPLTAVKQVSLQDVQLGKPALSIHGRHYGFVQEQSEGVNSKKVLIPDINSGAYITSFKTIDQTLHLQQIVQLHKATDSTTPNPGTYCTAGRKFVRKQPGGLKMRFRPIGFGSGKTGAIGSSSPSTNTSSTTDTDTDESMEYSFPVPRQPLNIDQVDTRLLKNASGGSASQNDTSSSGEESDSPQRKIGTTTHQTEARSEPDISSEASNSDTEGSRNVISASPKRANSSPRPIKRKLDSFLRDHSSLDSIPEPLKADSASMKTTSANKMVSVFGKSGLETNGNESVSKRSAVSSLPLKLTKLSQPQLSIPSLNPINGLKQKVTPVPPPQQRPPVLTSQHWSKSPVAPGILNTTREAVRESSAKVVSLQSNSNKNSHKHLKDTTQSTDQAVGNKARKQDKRRVKKNEDGRMSKFQKGETTKSTVTDTLDKSVNSFSASRHIQERPSQAGSDTNSTVKRVLSQNGKPAIADNVGKTSKKIKNGNSTMATHDQDGERPRPSHNSSIAVPSPRKESVILPPKFNRSMSR